MSSPYEIKVAPAAQRAIKKLERPAQRRIIDCLKNLRIDSRPSGVEKLSQDPHFWRVRVGEYRVIYSIDDGANIVIVLIVRHRKDAYRDIEKLDPEIMSKALAPFLTTLAASG